MSRSRTTIVAVLFASAVACHPRPRPGAPPSPSFKCGTMACDPRTSYCETLKTDVQALPSQYACRPLPDACRATAAQPAPTCGCFPSDTRGDLCSASNVDGRVAFWRTTVGGH